MTDRRYDEQEIEVIFRAAASERVAEPRPVTDVARQQTGLTLSQLQQAGLEAGLSAEAVAVAAAALDVRSTSAVRTWLGLPVGVSRTVELGRALSDEEWERLVSRMRDVFDAHGITGVDGSARFWRNGNLRVLLEPSGSGHRLRFRTVSEAGQTLVIMGTAILGVVVVGAMAALSKGTLTRAAGALIPLGVLSTGSMVVAALRMRRWARTRAGQMEQLGEEAAKGR